MRLNINIIKPQGTKFPVLMQNLLTPPSLLCLHPILSILVCYLIHCSSLLLGLPALTATPTLCFPPADRVLPCQITALLCSRTFHSSSSFRVKAKVLPVAHKTPHNFPCSHLLPFSLLTLPQPHPSLLLDPPYFPCPRPFAHIILTT